MIISHCKQYFGITSFSDVPHMIEKRVRFSICVDMNAVIYFIDKIDDYVFRFLAQINDCAKILYEMIKYFALFRDRK